MTKLASLDDSVVYYIDLLYLYFFLIECMPPGYCPLEAVIKDFYLPFPNMSMINKTLLESVI